MAAALAEKQHPLTWKIPAELHNRCFNCLFYSHRVATCRLSRRCLHCRGFRHLTRECKKPRHAATSAAKDDHWPCHSARGGKQGPPSTGHTAAWMGPCRVPRGCQWNSMMTMAVPESTGGEHHLGHTFWLCYCCTLLPHARSDGVGAVLEFRDSCMG